VDTQKLIERLKERHHRITKARLDIINLLSEKPMTVHELFDRMIALGHPNIQTIYNNLSFLESEKLLYATLNRNSKEYHLVGWEKDPNTHVHIKCEANDDVFDIVEGELMAVIKKTLGLSGFDVDHIDISILGHCRHNVRSECVHRGTCMLKELVQTHMN
jgi:Fe2+ or Zn2+ uptake regulation protein